MDDDAHPDEFLEKWKGYIGHFDRLKLAANREEHLDICKAQETLETVVDAIYERKSRDVCDTEECDEEATFWSVNQNERVCTSCAKDEVSLGGTVEPL